MSASGRTVLRIGSGAVLLVLLVWYADPADVWRHLRGTDMRLFAGVVLVGLASSLLSALRWGAIARRLGLAAPTSAFVAMYGRGMTANTFLPGAPAAGDVLRSVQLARLGNGAGTSALSVLLDRASGLWVLCGLCLSAALVVIAMQRLSAVPFLAEDQLFAYALLLASAVCLPFFPAVLPVLRRMRSARRVLIASAPYSLGVQVAACGAFWMCGLAAGVALPVAVMIAAAAPVFILAALPIGVAGFGPREMGALLVLGALGVPAEQAIATGMLYGIAAIIQGVAVAPSYSVPD